MNLDSPSNGPDVQRWQQALVARGIVVACDGAFGPRTHNATLALQAAARLPCTGSVGDAEWLAVLTPWPELELPALPTALAFVECRYWARQVAPRSSVDWIVLHCMQSAETATTAERCAHYLANLPADEHKRSVHYMVDSDTAVQGVRDECVAWHAPGANHAAIGIEHAGYARQTEANWLDPFGARMLALSTQLTARLCQRWTIPLEFVTADELREHSAARPHRGITTHAEVTGAWPALGDHHDPGDGFPIEWYLATCRGLL